MKDELLNLANKADELYDSIGNDYAVPDIDLQKMNDFLSKRFSFSRPRPVSGIIEDVSMMLYRWTLHTNHPRHFGLYQPGLRSTGVIADALVFSI